MEHRSAIELTGCLGPEAQAKSMASNGRNRAQMDSRTYTFATVGSYRDLKSATL
jgi:hypothetical protein